MPKNFHLCGKKGIFIWIQLKSKLVKSDEKLFQCEYIFLECLSMDQVVINVGRYVCMGFDGNQDFCYTSGENLTSRCKAECQAWILIALALPRKGSFVAIEFINGDLAVVTMKIQY